MKLTTNLLLLFFATGFIYNCKNSPAEIEKDESFTFIERGDYYVDALNGRLVHILKDSKEVMNGYYVVGNELRKWEEFEIKDGLLHGDYLIFHENGEVLTQSIYKNGLKHGLEKVYYNSGKLKKETPYINNEIQGKETAYYEGGQLNNTTIYTQGELESSTTYDILGNIVTQTFLKDGIRITQQIVAGRLRSEVFSSTYDDFEAMKLYNEQGDLLYFVRMIVDGEDLYYVQLDENKKEIERVNVKKEPEKFLKFKASLQEIVDAQEQTTSYHLQ